MTSRLIPAKREWTCDRCSIVREGKDNSRPAGWGSCRLHTSGDALSYDLCPDCAKVAENALSRPRPAAIARVAEMPVPDTGGAS